MDVLNDAPLSRRDFLITGASSVALTAVPAAAATGEAAGGASDSAGAPVVMGITLNVNDTARALDVDTRTTLLDALREHLHLTGTQEGLRPGPVRCLHCSRRRTAQDQCRA